jgi:hypothetical protein
MWCGDSISLTASTAWLLCQPCNACNIHNMHAPEQTSLALETALPHRASAATAEAEQHHCVTGPARRSTTKAARCLLCISCFCSTNAAAAAALTCASPGVSA